MMENNLLLNGTLSIDDNDDEINLNRERTSYGNTGFSPAIVNMVDETGELTEVYHSQLRQEIELPDEEEIEEMAKETFISIQSQNAFVVGFKYAYDKIYNQK